MTARDAIARAILAPEHFVGVRPVGETISEWQARATEAALSAAGFSIVPPGEGVADAVEVGASAIERIDFPRGLRPLGITGRRIIAEAVLTATAPHMSVPDGWVLVPEEPTGDMLDAAGGAGARHLKRRIWRDMLSARPKGGA